MNENIDIKVVPYEDTALYNLNDIDLVIKSGLFDIDYYAKNYKGGLTDLFVEHYLNVGWRSGKNPSSRFDGSKYLLSNHDVEVSGYNPLVHFIRYGQSEGRSYIGFIDFSEMDLKINTSTHVNRQENSEQEIESEFDKTLIRESRLFDASWYMEQYSEDLLPYVVQHYLSIGWTTGANPSRSFDGNRYLHDNPDVLQAKDNPLLHYVKYGHAENRVYRECATEIISEEGISAENISDRKLVEDSGLFDEEFYLEQYPDLNGMDLIDHYINHGGVEGRRPGPNFDGDKYLYDSPDLRSQGVNPLVHYLRCGKNEGRHPGLSTKNLKTLESALPGFIRCEPEISRDQAFERLDRLSVNQSIRHTHLNQAWSRIFSSINNKYDRIIFAPWLVRGGADLVAANAAHSCINQHGPHSVLVVITDHDRIEASDWLPETADMLVISDYGRDLSHHERVRIVEMIIFALLPSAILNVNSYALWDAISRRGVALSQITKIYAALFCRDYGTTGIPAGYADTHFLNCMPHLTKLYVDNHPFINELSEHYLLPSTLRQRISMLPQPIANNMSRRKFYTTEESSKLKLIMNLLPRSIANRFLNLKGPTEKADIKFRVLWSGRFTRQKNIELLMKIIEMAPHIEFSIFGTGDAADKKNLDDFQLNNSNVKIYGSFSSISELPVASHDVYLFTSLWEGMPTTLINIAATGIPIVASDVGGVSDLVTDKTGWLIRDFNDPSAYISALEEVRNDRHGSLVRADMMLDLVYTRHSWENYTKSFLEYPSFIG